MYRVKRLKSEPVPSNSDSEAENFQYNCMQNDEIYDDDDEDGINFTDNGDDDAIADTHLKARDPTHSESDEPYSKMLPRTTEILENFLKDSGPVPSSNLKPTKEYIHSSLLSCYDLQNDVIDFILHDEQFLRDFHEFALNESGLLTKLTESLQDKLFEKEDLQHHLEILDNNLIKKAEQLDLLRVKIQCLQNKLSSLSRLK
jgi:hypothetical protein